MKEMLHGVEASVSPTSCPFCGSTKIKTASEKADSSAYWRCEVCGDMWNPSRLRPASSRYHDDLRWK